MGFVAGTLVHTDKGVVPIEQLKVGDMVLSKHESGEGEQAYKSIINVLKNENIHILQMSYYEASNPMHELKAQLLYITAGHLIWMLQDENDNLINDWIPAQDIVGGSKVIFANDTIVEVGHITEVWATHHQDIGFTYDCMDELEIVIDVYDNKIQAYYIGENVYTADSSQPDKWTTTDFSDEIIVPSDEHTIKQKFQEFLSYGHELISRDARFTTTVYNLEIADCNNYFVGKSGILVAAQK